MCRISSLVVKLNFSFLKLPTLLEYTRHKVQNLELVAFVEPLMPLKDPVENGIERSKDETMFEWDGRTLHQRVNQSYHLYHINISSSITHFINVWITAITCTIHQRVNQSYHLYDNQTAITCKTSISAQSFHHLYVLHLQPTVSVTTMIPNQWSDRILS